MDKTEGKVLTVVHKVEEGAETDAWDSLNIYVDKDNYRVENEDYVKV
jgi:hypothetical protein